MFEKFNRYWEEYGLEGLAIFAGIVIIVLFLYNWFTNKQGTYSDGLSPSYFGSKTLSFGPLPRDPFMNYRQHTVRDSKLELAAKYHLEDMFQLPFYKIRPDFLKNEATGRNLEIDLFCKELNLAVEIQGIQHYKFSPKFHLTEQQFQEQQQRDQMKAHKCRQRGIKLIEIPYHVKERDVRSYLQRKLREQGIL
jgi:hypothetical protein